MSCHGSLGVTPSVGSNNPSDTILWMRPDVKKTAGKSNKVFKSSAATLVAGMAGAAVGLLLGMAGGPISMAIGAGVGGLVGSVLCVLICTTHF